ncbi:MAG: hypothetical protein JW839_11005 [Candidatus Lokiarchaeota archaeon]|nr:hypothetical protein [Candidatus Lokiarchaeota archaeon]
MNRIEKMKYRALVDVFIVQVAGYQDTIISEFYNRAYILAGWGEDLWRIEASMIETTLHV